MHPKYTTPAFLISMAQFGEADRMVSLYTKDFGMVGALAKSVRLLKSKLKSALEEGNYLSVSLVRGKEIWRLIDAEVIPNMNPQSKEFSMFLKITKLLKGLIQGEEKNEKLFGILEDIRKDLFEKKFKEAELDSFECLSVLKILDSLGYGREHESLGFSIYDPVDVPILQLVEKNKMTIVSLINKSLQESHL